MYVLLVYYLKVQRRKLFFGGEIDFFFVYLFLVYKYFYLELLYVYQSVCGSMFFFRYYCIIDCFLQ